LLNQTWNLYFGKIKKHLIKSYILKNLKYTLLLALTMVNKQPAIAQQSNSSNGKQNFYSDETVFLSTNATTFVTGETIFYKLNCLKLSNKTQSNVSKIAYVELIDSDKKSVLTSKLYLENAYSQGEYFVPTTLKTGNYKLIGYTNWILNQPVSEIFQIDITIKNPFKSNSKRKAN